MERFFRLNKPVYYKADAVRVSSDYDKRLGCYCIKCEVVELIPTDNNGWLYGKIFCSEYYNMGGDGYDIIAKSSRRNAKKAMLTEKAMENAREYAEKYVTHIGKGELNIVEEV